jgi:putative transcriptional regulator
MRKRYKSESLAAIYETAEGLHRVGLMDKQAMRELDALCLKPVEPDQAATTPKP